MQMFRGDGYTKYHVVWPSQGQVMTGTISLPDGAGPFPVVIVNHGHIPTGRYWVGQDSGIFGDPMAAHGFISMAPNYPGYAGSGTLDPAYPDVVAEAVADLDLISSLGSLPQASASRVANSAVTSCARQWASRRARLKNDGEGAAQDSLPSGMRGSATGRFTPHHPMPQMRQRR